MYCGFVTADALGAGLLALQGIHGAASPISGIPVSILLGMAINKFVLPRYSDSFRQKLAPGLATSSKLLLQLGIVCIGMKLSVYDILALGSTVFPAVVFAIGCGLSFTIFLAERLKLSRKMGLLIGAGTSICGVTAITALAPAIKANQQEVSFAVATVVGFGTFSMLTYPYLAHFIFPHSEQVGLFLGLAVHDTSQVMGSAMTYAQVYGDKVALQWATVTKLSRNICLGLVIPLISTLNSRREAREAREAAGGEIGKQGELGWFSLSELKKHVPLFVLGFLGMAVVRSIGDATLISTGLAYGFIDPTWWQGIVHIIGNNLGTDFLGTAMAAVGLNTNFNVLKGVGATPFVAGFGGALSMGLLACLLAFGLGLGSYEGEDVVGSTAAE